MRGLMSAITVVAVCAMMFVGSAAWAEELRATGKSSVRITGEEIDAYKRARRNAMRDAVLELVVKVVGPSAREDEVVRSNLDTLADQLGDYFDDEEVDTIDEKVEVRLVARIDATELRSLIREQGIAGSQVAAAATKIMVMIDDYLTVPTDFQTPAEVITEFSSKKKSSFSDQSLKAASSVSASDSKASFNQNVDARSARATSVRANESASVASGARVTGQGGSISASEAASVNRSGSIDSASASSLKAKTSASAQSSSFDKSSAIDRKNVRAASSDEVSFRNVVRYQVPDKKPSSARRVETAVLTKLGEESIQTRSSDIFRSSYFKGKNLTVDELASGKQLASFIAAASSDKNLDADYMMFGTATIVDLGKDPRTGQHQCGGMLNIRAYHAKTSRNLTSGTANETAVAMSPDNCAQELADRLAAEAAPTVARILLRDFKEAQMFGSQYDLIVVGSTLGLRVSRAISSILSDLKVENPLKKEDTGQKVEYSIMYKGQGPLDEEFAFRLMEKLGIPDANEPQRKVEGSRVVICLDNCKALLR